MLCSPSIYNNHNPKTKEIFQKVEEKFYSTVTDLRDLFDVTNQVSYHYYENIDLLTIIV
jgi:hypothetical protein